MRPIPNVQKAEVICLGWAVNLQRYSTQPLCESCNEVALSPSTPERGAAPLLNVHLQPAGMFLLSRLRSQQGVGCPTQAGWVAQRGLQQPAPAASAILHPTAPHPNTHPMQPFPRANGQTTSCHCSRNKARTTPFFCK